MNGIIIVVNSILMLCCMTGCKKQDVKISDEDIAAIKSVILKMYYASINGNKTAFVDCFPNTEAQKKLAIVCYDFSIAYRNFYRKILIKYGRNAWAKYLNTDIDGPAYTYRSKWPDSPSKLLAESAFIVTGDTVTVKCTNIDRDFVLKKHNGVWKLVIDYGNMTPDEYIKLAQRHMEAFHAAIKAMDTPDVTLKQIKILMSKIVLADMYK